MDYNVIILQRVVHVQKRQIHALHVDNPIGRYIRVHVISSQITGNGYAWVPHCKIEPRCLKVEDARYSFSSSTSSSSSSSFSTSSSSSSSTYSSSSTHSSSKFPSSINIKNASFNIFYDDIS